MKFKVFYSQEKDIWNHLNTNWRFGYTEHGRKNIQERLLKHYPEDFKVALKKASTEKEAVEAIKDFLESLPKHIKNTTPIIAAGLEVVLNKKKEEIVNNLESAYGKKFPFSEISVYLTTANLNPYSYKKRWFMSGRNSSIEGHIRTAKHELNHFMFYYYYPELKEELGNEKYEQLKEALAIFTNPEGNDKPAVKRLETFFSRQKGTVSEIIKKGEWRDQFI